MFQPVIYTQAATPCYFHTWTPRRWHSYLLRFLFLSLSSLTYLSFHTGHCVCDLVGIMLFYTKMSLHLSSLVNVCNALSLPDKGGGGGCACWAASSLSQHQLSASLSQSWSQTCAFGHVSRWMPRGVVIKHGEWKWRSRFAVAGRING